MLSSSSTSLPIDHATRKEAAGEGIPELRGSKVISGVESVVEKRQRQRQREEERGEGEGGGWNGNVMQEQTRLVKSREGGT